MINKRLLLLLGGLALLVLVPSIFLKTSVQNKGQGSVDSKEQVSVTKTEEANQGKTGTLNTVTLTPKFEVEGNKFEILGIIESVSGSSFVVNGHMIAIDQSRVVSFEQKGILTVGAVVKAEGIVIGGQNFAQDIKVGVENIGKLRSGGDNKNSNSGKGK